LGNNLQLDCHPDVTDIVYGTKSAQQIDTNRVQMTWQNCNTEKQILCIYLDQLNY